MVSFFVDAKIGIICVTTKKKRLQKCANYILRTFAKELFRSLQLFCYLFHCVKKLLALERKKERVLFVLYSFFRNFAGKLINKVHI